MLYAPESHTGQYIKDMTNGALEEWGLVPGGVTAITTDNAANNQSACRFGSECSATVVELQSDSILADSWRSHLSQLNNSADWPLPLTPLALCMM